MFIGIALPETILQNTGFLYVYVIRISWEALPSDQEYISDYGQYRQHDILV
jgi:hypothetical protein